MLIHVGANLDCEIHQHKCNWFLLKCLERNRWVVVNLKIYSVCSVICTLIVLLELFHCLPVNSATIQLVKPHDPPPSAGVQTCTVWFSERHRTIIYLVRIRLTPFKACDVRIPTVY